MSSRSHPAFILLCSLIAGCGSDSTDGDDGSRPPPGTVLSPELVRQVLPDGSPAGAPPVHQADPDRLVISSGATTYTLRRHLDGRIPAPEFFTPYNLGFEFGTDVADAARGGTAAGSGQAYVTLIDGIRVELGHERLSETVLPTSGSASYAGTYMGLLSTVSGASYLGYITGDASLDADFGRMSVSGEITNRVGTHSFPYQFDPLQLLPGAIEPASGRFGAETAGGKVDGLPGYFAAAGSYSGLLVGPAGEEIVGNVLVEHDFNGTPAVREAGAFVAD